MSRFLFLSIDGITDPLGQSQVIPYLAGLAAKGFDITIISCEKKENFMHNEKMVRHTLDMAGIQWEYCFYSKKIPLLSQRGNLQRLKKLAVQFSKKTKGKLIVHCRSYLPALIGLHLQTKYNARFIFDMRGFWADERVEGGIWKLKNPLHKSAYVYFKRKEKQLISKADHIVTLSDVARKIILDWKIAGTPDISTIPCCVDLDHFTPRTREEKKEMRKKLDLESHAFVFGYLGSLGTWYMLEEMLDFFKEALKEDPHAKLLFVTTDNPADILSAAKKKSIPAAKIIVRAATRNEVPQYISVFNAGLFFIRPTFSKKASSPTKMAEILACGVPVITNIGIGDCDTIIRETRCGVLVNDFNVDGYRAALHQMNSVKIDPDYLRSISEKYFSLKDGMAHYANIYRQLTVPRKAKQ